ncbi:hypothetical protein C2G38_2043788 [Gigaspora rosea]|uniref:Uncharacterized protein n=1 Tax=Gigaspora rosea TaxID=44941 RepID=A0A397URK9_9GLOM|nr:hypothetical protein C2G38_2043788 [Gigaspora rosea]
MEHDNVFYDINSDNNTSENEENFVDSSEVFNETKFNITWNPEDQFSIFENFTTIAMFTWAVEHMICSISSCLYFGPGILTESCEELWEGNLWAESPLFDQSKINNFARSFKCDDFIKYFSDETLQHR